MDDTGTSAEQARRQLVALCYGDCQTPPLAARSLHFRTERLSVREARSLLDVIGGYNRFEPDRTAAVLKAFEGNDHVTVEVGREGSPVIYVTAVDDKTRAAVKRALVKARPSELSEECFTIRAWWD